MRMTVKSREVLDLKIKSLKKELEDVYIIKQEARNQGDLSENFDYQQACENIDHLMKKITELEDIRNRSFVETIEHQTNFIDLDSVVELFDRTNNKTIICKIVGSYYDEEEKNYDKVISEESPLGQLLIKKKVNDLITLKVPNGLRQYEILKLLSY